MKTYSISQEDTGGTNEQLQERERERESATMATISPSFVRLPNAFPLASSSPKTHTPKPVSSFATRATDPETPPAEPAPESGSDPDEFDNRLSQVRLRYRSGTGKKAEIRKSRKSKGSGSGSDNVFLPPVPLKEPVSGGLKVDFGFSPYSERVNGRVALLGLTALLLVELATGKSVLKFHTPPVVLIQVYFVAAATAIYIKYEKERVSVWPKQ